MHLFYSKLVIIIVHMVWEPALDAMQSEITEKGYFHWPKSWPEFIVKYDIMDQGRTPTRLSIDFWRKQRPELTQRGWYVIRLGEGGFVILYEEAYPKPYLDLSIRKPQEIPLRTPSSYAHLKKPTKKCSLADHQTRTLS